MKYVEMQAELKFIAFLWYNKYLGIKCLTREQYNTRYDDRYYQRFVDLL